MLIQVNYGDVTKTDAIENFVNEQVEHHLAHVADRITRVEVHLRDDSSESKHTGDDKRCTMEARPAGRPPLAVEHRGDNMQKVVAEAAGKLERAVKHAFERAK